MSFSNKYDKANLNTRLCVSFCKYHYTKKKIKIINSVFDEMNQRAISYATYVWRSPVVKGVLSEWVSRTIVRFTKHVERNFIKISSKILPEKKIWWRYQKYLFI